MFIHKDRHDVARIFERRTRAANIFAFVRERYNCVKYKNNLYHKGALLWASLPIVAKNSLAVAHRVTCAGKSVCVQKPLHSLEVACFRVTLPVAQTFACTW